MLALIFAFCPEIITDEAGHTHSITMAEGYYLWIVSFFVLFIGVIIYHKQMIEKEFVLIYEKRHNSVLVV